MAYCIFCVSNINSASVKFFDRPLAGVFMQCRLNQVQPLFQARLCRSLAGRNFVCTVVRFLGEFQQRCGTLGIFRELSLPSGWFIKGTWRVVTTNTIPWYSTIVLLWGIEQNYANKLYKCPDYIYIYIYIDIYIYSLYLYLYLSMYLNKFHAISISYHISRSMQTKNNILHVCHVYNNLYHRYTQNMYTMCVMYFMYIMCMYMCIYSIRVTRTHTQRFMHSYVYIYIYAYRSCFSTWKTWKKTPVIKHQHFSWWFPGLDATSLKATMAQVWFPLSSFIIPL